MIALALLDGLMVAPKPGLRATCPRCAGQVISKCGLQVRHHFAHLPGAPCVDSGAERPAPQPVGRGDTDSWGEPETDWHRNWKAAFPEAWREVRLEGHRADIHTPRGLTVEFQHSALTYAEVRSRTDYYLKFGPFLWVVDASALTQELRFGPIPADPGRPHHLFFTAARLPAGFNQVRDVWLDLGHLPTDAARLVFLVTKWPGRYWAGKGFALSHAGFLNCLLSQEIPHPWNLTSATG
jgi:hypothetical protein